MYDIKDTAPDFILKCPTGDLTILEGSRKSGKTMLACKMALAYLKENPDHHIAIVSQDSTIDDISQRCDHLIGIDLAYDEFIDYLTRMVVISGIYNYAEFLTQPKRLLHPLRDVGAIFYDIPHLHEELYAVVKMFPNTKHLAIFQKPYPLPSV